MIGRMDEGGEGEGGGERRERWRAAHGWYPNDRNKWVLKQKYVVVVFVGVDLGLRFDQLELTKRRPNFIFAYLPMIIDCLPLWFVVLPRK